jgi:MFS family permease
VTADQTSTISKRRRNLVLAAMCVALATVVSAVTSLNVALPDIARELGATQTRLQWIVDAYSVVFAGLLLFAGALGDRVGRRPMLLGGSVAAVAVFVFWRAPRNAMTAVKPTVRARVVSEHELARR